MRGSAGSDEPGSGGVGFATRDRFSSFAFNEKSVLCLSDGCHVRSLRAFIRVRDLMLEVHLRNLNVRVPIGYDLKLLSDFVIHASSCWSCCLQLIPVLRRPAPRISSLERVGLHLVIICTLVLSLLVPIVLRELFVTVVCSPENFDSFSELLTRAPSLLSVYQKLCS